MGIVKGIRNACHGVINKPVTNSGSANTDARSFGPFPGPQTMWVPLREAYLIERIARQLHTLRGQVARTTKRLQ
jgi:hypothetical protein